MNNILVARHIMHYVSVKGVKAQNGSLLNGIKCPVHFNLLQRNVPR